MTLHNIFITNLLILNLLNTSCSQESNKLYFSKFQNTVYLKGDQINLKYKIKGCLPNCYDSLLILTSAQGYNKQVIIYSLKDFKYVASTITPGRGPDEISFPGHIIINKNRGLIWCQDFGRKILWKFDLDSIINKDKYFPDYKINTPDILAIMQLDLYNDSIFSFNSNNPSYFVSFFNENGNIIDTLNVPSQACIYNNEQLSPETKTLMAYYIYTINPKTGRIAIIYMFSDIIQIIDSRGNLLKELHGPGTTDQIPEYANSQQIITNSLVYSDKNYIYCLYRNRRRWDEVTGMIPQFGKEINVYSWDGKPILKIILDHSVMAFTIDNKNKRIITFSPEIDELLSYKFNIDEIINN